jgi:pyrroline-5-carboxylate reductase
VDAAQSGVDSAVFCCANFLTAVAGQIRIDSRWRGRKKMGTVFSDKRLAVLGAGKMGGILLQSLLKNGLFSPALTRATVQHSEKVRALADKLHVEVGTDNAQAVHGADIVLLCVKPQVVEEVATEIGPQLAPGQLIISVAASVSTSLIEKALCREVPVVRAMPNTPAAQGCGMTGLCKGKFANAAHLEMAAAMFNVVGRTVVVDEKHMDAVTGLSASGPAYIYIIIESLAEAGVKVGLPRDVATLLAAQTTMGAARVVLETGDHPALLKDAVTTPAGCTVDGILELEEGGLRVTLIKAVVKATQRAKELAFVG